MSNEISVIGAGVIDVLAGPTDELISTRGSSPMDYVTLAYGGDALNEAVALSRLGKRVQWIGKLGDDDAGEKILSYAKSNGLDVGHMTIRRGEQSGVTVVLVDKFGERRFLTNTNSTLRTQEESDILPHVDALAPIVSFASMFISYRLNVSAMTRLFKRIKSSGRTLVVDTKQTKHGETLDDVAELLPCMDYFLPNESELAMLTSGDDVHENIAALLNRGLPCVVVKVGGKGCIIARKDELIEIPACPVEKVIDTTGAGDCFAAGFLFALLEGWSLAECGRFACATASCSVEEVGAVTGVTNLQKVMRRYKSS
ncbi:MAG: carbohydrate kinase family protein [Selenomonadaceae bacterium]|nr:carbohydrate kinase family protein [Selenomonadaceae bacterium]